MYLVKFLFCCCGFDSKKYLPRNLLDQFTHRYTHACICRMHTHAPTHVSNCLCVWCVCVCVRACVCMCARACACACVSHTSICVLHSLLSNLSLCQCSFSCVVLPTVFASRVLARSMSTEPRYSLDLHQLRASMSAASKACQQQVSMTTEPRNSFALHEMRVPFVRTMQCFSSRFDSTDRHLCSARTHSTHTLCL